MHKATSGYDDVPWERYHFPQTYRNLVARSEGDFFVYYEPRRDDGREAYVAMGRLGTITPDPQRADHFYVGVTDYRPFSTEVPWKMPDGTVIESQLLKSDGSTNKGRFGRAVHELPTSEFTQIVELGFADVLAEEDPAIPLPAAAEVDVAPRRIVEMVMQRRVRERAFTKNVRNAYGQTCAFTGLKIVNGGGWTEMEAAHIRPVEKDGPDSIRNGLALSRTMHALFDRGFLSLTDDFRIIEASSVPELPKELRALLPADRRALMPSNAAIRPHPSFLSFHRREIFKDRLSSS